MSATPLEADKKSHLPDDFEVQGGYSPSDGPSDGPQRQIQHDAVFGDLDEAGPNYRSVGWVMSGIIMIKTMLGLGVLSIPAVFDTLGMIPGVICMLAISAVTTWCAIQVQDFKILHPSVYGVDDAGFLMVGRWGREILYVAFLLCWIFVGGSGMVSTSIALNAVSEHGTCSAVFTAIAAILTFCLASIRTLNKMSWLAWVGTASVLIATLTLTVAVGVQDRPAAAPHTGEWKPDFKLFNNPPFHQGISAIGSLIFAFGGIPALFSVIAEMKEPRDFRKSLAFCQTVLTVTYLIVGIVVYRYCGSFVSNPALGSAGVLMKKVCYGLALPGVLVSTVLITHFPAKLLFVRLLRGSRHLTSNNAVHWATWLGSVASITIVSYIIASAVPIFGGLVSLIGALFVPLMSYQPMGGMWLYDNWKYRTSRGKTFKWRWDFGWSVFVIVFGTFIMVAGTYGAIKDIIISYKESGGTLAWSCADNSNSV
ncbi:transmembrane amino acid transporter protein-domain-containing protein [Papiliotrema laurentii]|uniref:Transmembrane amino acid transporter protein-domain-containing protein n=1 Tax=Papiliotrema laurentii TaxID=5418 RepID=A0AAD9FP28_PAPLA|nr:transmembrane amino acid transporter protein-domain-containing protein [Papiliotrema laurentii]